MRLIDSSIADFDVIRSEFRWAIPDKLNIAHQVCERHQQRAQQVAVYYENAAGERKSYRFADLKKYSDQFANALRASGIERGDRVAIVLPQTIETIVAHLAIHKLGAVSLRRSNIACVTVARALLSFTPVVTMTSGRCNPNCPTWVKSSAVVAVMPPMNSGHCWRAVRNALRWCRPGPTIRLA